MSPDRMDNGQRENNRHNRNDQVLHQRLIINAISNSLRNIGDNFNDRYGARNMRDGERFAQDIVIEEIVHHCVAIFFQLYRLFRQT